MVRGVADFPFTRQYRNTLPYLYFYSAAGAMGAGLAAGAGGCRRHALRSVGTGALDLPAAGDVRVALGRKQGKLRSLDDRQLAELDRVELGAALFAITGAFLAKFNRYMSPVLPFVLLWAAWLVVALWERGARERKRDLEIKRLEIGDSENERLEIGDSGSDDAASPRSQISLSQSPSRSIPRLLALILATLGLVGGLLWSLAFVNGVYNREHTWITASR